MVVCKSWNLPKDFDKLIGRIKSLGFYQLHEPNVLVFSALKSNVLEAHIGW